MPLIRPITQPLASSQSWKWSMASVDASLEVAISNPKNGWIQVAVSANGEHLNEMISYTPNDFILELISGLSLAMQGVDAVAVAFCEPVTYEIRFTQLQNQTTTQLQIVRYSNWNRNRGSAFEVLSFQAPTTDVVLQFWRALRNLEGRCSAAEYREAMRTEFPSVGLERLSQLVKGHGQ